MREGKVDLMVDDEARNLVVVNNKAAQAQVQTGWYYSVKSRHGERAQALRCHCANVGQGRSRNDDDGMDVLGSRA